METLHQLFPHHQTDHLLCALQQCNGNVEDAADLIISTRQEESQIESQVGPESMLPPSDANVNLPAECFIVNLFKEVPSTQTMIWHETDCIPNFKTPCFYALTDGNCGPHALGMMLNFMAHKSVPLQAAEHSFVAKEVREYVSDFLFLNWCATSKIANEAWHEIVYYSHNVAVTEEERDTYPDWGADPGDRLERWIMERDDHFYTQSDFVCFNEAMQHHGIFVVFRIWRQNRSRLTRVATIPENAPVLQKHVVFDFKHTGTNDSSNAHWQLIKSGSAMYLQHKKRRSEPVDYTGMDDFNALDKTKGKKKVSRH